jgi:hypothetical protein
MKVMVCSAKIIQLPYLPRECGNRVNFPLFDVNEISMIHPDIINYFIIPVLCVRRKKTSILAL